MDQSNTDVDKKKLNEDMVVFMKKRSDHEVPRYTARLKTYVDFQRKRQRANAARHHCDYRSARLHEDHLARDIAGSPSGNGRKEKEQKEKAENAGWFGKPNDDEKTRGRSLRSRSRSDLEASEGCPRRGYRPYCSRYRTRCCRRRRRYCSRRRRKRCRRRRRRCSRRRRRRRRCR